MITEPTPSFDRNAPEISPVYAPESCADRSCAPSPNGILSASMSVCTERRSVNGGNTATSTDPSSWPASLSVQCSFCTVATACR